MMRKLLFILLMAIVTSSQGISLSPPSKQPSDTVAVVGDQVITFSQLNTQLNSSAVVGLSIPALGSPSRHKVILTLLDKAISANLLYLDALSKRVHLSPQYQQELKVYTDGLLVGLYKKSYLASATEVTDAEIEQHARSFLTLEGEVGERERLLAEAQIRKERMDELKINMRKNLRDGFDVRVYSDKLQPEGDATRDDNEVIAQYSGHQIIWGEMKKHLTTPNNAVDWDRRLKKMNELLDNQLMAILAKAKALDRSPVYKKRLEEFSKSRISNLHRQQLASQFQPTQEELLAFYNANRSAIAFEEHRKIQMIVLNNRNEAESIKKQIEGGEMTFYEAALNHSIDPRVKQTLGDYGWVEKGSGFAKLDDVVFSMFPGEVGGPVESPAGWHLILVTDQRDEKYTDFSDEETKSIARRFYLKKKMQDYVVDLRTTGNHVAVYQSNLERLLTEEARWIAEKAKEMEAKPEMVSKILDNLRSLTQ